MSFHGTTVGMYDLPCSYKVRHELKATEELRRLDFNYGKTTTFQRPSRDVAGNEEEVEASLESLMSKLFAFNDQDNPRGTSQFKAWQACPTPQEHHQGQYLRRRSSPRLIKPETREFGPEFGRSSSATEPSSETKLLRRGILTQETRAKSDTVIKTHAERQQDGEWHRQKMSPHTSLKFYHFDKPTDYMKYYNDRVTSNNIRSHIQTRLQQNAAQKSVTVSKKEKAHKVCTTRNKYFRFRVSTDNSGTEYGILRVGACTARAKPMEKIEIDCTKGKIKGSKILHQQKDNAPLQKMVVSKTTKIATMYDIKKVAKDKHPFSNDSNSVFSPNMFGGVAKPSAHSTTVQTSKPSCKNVRIKEWEAPTPTPTPASLHYQMAKHGMANINKVKPKVHPKKNTSEVPVLQRKLPYKQTLGEKEFLHITTPKPLSSSHTESTVQVNGESPSHTPITWTSRNLLKSPSFVECALIPRNAGNISNELFLKREPQAAIPKNSHFRACITPSNYSSSSIANQLKEREEPEKADEITSCVELYPSDDHIEGSNKLHRVASRPSVPQIGPFILG